VGSARWRPATECCWKTLWKLCIADAYPVSEGHSLVIPRRQGADGLELHQPEWNAVVELVHSI
jgi:diadenosine tetraphosphate (Ap4A) HIT family hydrolase